MSKKAYISWKVKNYTDRLFDNKCYFCKYNLSKPEKFEKQYHHFMKESDGSKTCEEALVLCCVHCHRKLHTKIKKPAQEVRDQLSQIINMCLYIKPILESVQELNNWKLNMEYMHFRKSIYGNLCSALGIIPTRGDLYGYDDDLTFGGLEMNGKLLKAILTRCDKIIGGMKIIQCAPRPKHEFDANRIKKIVLEWYDSIFIENERNRFDTTINRFMQAVKNNQSTQKALAEVRQEIETNHPEQARICRELEHQIDEFRRLQNNVP